MAVSQSHELPSIGHTQDLLQSFLKLQKFLRVSSDGLKIIPQIWHGRVDALLELALKFLHQPDRDVIKERPFFIAHRLLKFLMTVQLVNVFAE